MIRKYFDVLDEQTISDFFQYLQSLLDRPVWTSSNEWSKCLVKSSSIISICRITNPLIENKIKKRVQDLLNLDFESMNMVFHSSIYLWSRMSYITWHDDATYPYNGTIYLNQDWNSDDGGIFLWRDNKTNEIRGIEPIYNSMVVNSYCDEDPLNYHCVSSIVPAAPTTRVTIQWRAYPVQKNKNKKNILKEYLNKYLIKAIDYVNEL